MENNTVYQEIRYLSQKIENNRASLEDYKRYEKLLLSQGISHDYLFTELKKAGFTTWEQFLHAKKEKQDERNLEIATGFIAGIGIGVLLLAVFDRK
ncbi:MAG: hypothetical protein MUC49_14720 [Raineya sp.]|jgi:hypothetical protein|nr:hypothetical protein [Raineya sp.]